MYISENIKTVFLCDGWEGYYIWVYIRHRHFLCGIYKLIHPGLRWVHSSLLDPFKGYCLISYNITNVISAYLEEKDGL